MGAQAGNAGTVWFDLLIKNTIGRQIEKISREAGAQAEKQFDTVGEKAGKSFSQAFDRSVANAQRTLKRLETQHEEVTAKMDAMRQAKIQDYDNPMMSKRQKADAAMDVLSKDKQFQALAKQQERVYQQIQAARDRLEVAVEAAAAKQASAEARFAEKAAQAAQRAGNRQEMAAKRAADEAQRAQEKAAEASCRAHERAAKRVQGAWAKAMGVVKGVQSGAASFVKKSWTKATNGISKAFHTVGRTMRRVFVLGALLVFFHGLRDAMSAAIKQNDQLSKSLAQVKGNLYTAFSAVFSAVLPALTAMMNGLAALTNKIASFLSALFGTTYAKSQAAAKQLASVGKGAAGASKKLQGSLASWDKLNVLQKEDTSGSGGGSASGVDTGARADEAAASFGETLRKAFQSGNWDALGQILGEKFNAMVDKLDTTALGTKLGKGIQAAIQTAHSFIQTADWNNLGAKIADGLNHALDRVDAWQLGSILASKWTIAFGTLNGFIQNTDWAQVAEKLSAGIRGLYDTMAVAIQNFNWSGLADSICTFLCNIDWAGIFESVATFAGSCVGSALSFFWTLAENAYNGLSGFFLEKIQEAGGDVILGFLHGIGEGLANIGIWIFDHIFKPFWDGICAAFQIHSPSKKMMEIGRYIVAGMLNGITESWQRVASFFAQALADVKAVFSNAWAALKANTAQMWRGIGDTIKAAVNNIIGIVNNMISAVTGGINAAVDALNRIHVDIPDWVPGFGGKRFGINIPHVGTPQIPMLAKGGVIKQPTLAMMGEYQGAGSNPEIVAPQSIMRETFEESIAPLVEAIYELIAYLKEGGDKEIVIKLIFNGNLAQFARIVKPYLDKESNRVGVKLITGGED